MRVKSQPQKHRSRFEWTENDTRYFITEFRKRKCLWSVWPAAVKANAIDELQTLMVERIPNITIASIKRKIKNLCCNYRLQEKKNTSSLKETSLKTLKQTPLWYFDLMSFLSPENLLREKMTEETYSSMPKENVSIHKLYITYT